MKWESDDLKETSDIPCAMCALNVQIGRALPECMSGHTAEHTPRRLTGHQNATRSSLSKRGENKRSTGQNRQRARMDLHLETIENWLTSHDQPSSPACQLHTRAKRTAYSSTPLKRRGRGKHFNWHTCVCDPLLQPGHSCVQPKKREQSEGLRCSCAPMPSMTEEQLLPRTWA